ncbi:Actin-like protein 87C [Papilio machaon]|uniref:Actin-like protein 87C n=1 Tax=Papilio machaon TaxID=76193 RepID=A0A0N0PDF6_PAPMA|nr:Actin-like protein 87C [Papilio machaon]
MELNDVIVNQPVVIDNGSGVIKAGFAGDQIPKCRFPNYIGRPKHVRVMAGALEGELFVGPRAEEHRGLLSINIGRPKHVRVMAGALEGELFVGPRAEEHRGLLSIKYPMEHGIVTDWNDMERVWNYIYSRTTGVVLDSGDGVTHAVPIYEGFAMPHSIMRVDVAGRDVTRYLRLLLRKEGVNLRTSAELEIVKAIKERACYLSPNPLKEETLDSERAQYTLPDGTLLEIGQARFRAPEVLFRPDLIGEECEGLHEVLMFSIQKSDMDLRKVLYQNIVLSGGSTLFRGFGDRLLAEIRRLAPKDMKIRISAPQERLYSTWIGGSILASLDTFRKMWVSKREYDEEGQRAVHRKTF